MRHQTVGARKITRRSVQLGTLAVPVRIAPSGVAQLNFAPFRNPHSFILACAFPPISCGRSKTLLSVHNFCKQHHGGDFWPNVSSFRSRTHVTFPAGAIDIVFRRLPIAPKAQVLYERTGAPGHYPWPQNIYFVSPS